MESHGGKKLLLPLLNFHAIALKEHHYAAGQSVKTGVREAVSVIPTINISNHI